MDGKHKLFSKVFCPTIQLKTDIRADWGLALALNAKNLEWVAVCVSFYPPNIPDHISLNIEIPTSLSWIIQPTPEGMIRKEYKKANEYIGSFTVQL